MYSFAHLSDEELVAQLQTCCFDLRRFKVHVLAFLGEVEERRIHLLAAASSVWDYCRSHLRMSHGSAYRFMKGAELCKRFPFLLEGIDKGEIHLSTLVHIASFITDDNVRDLVEETRDKNRNQVDLVLLRRFGREPSNGRVSDPMPYDQELLDLMQRARQCTYVDERTGARCPSRAFIQRDHRRMRVHGGTDVPENLRPMCSAHNRLLAELALGRGYIERRIRHRRRKQMG